MSLAKGGGGRMRVNLPGTPGPRAPAAAGFLKKLTGGNRGHRPRPRRALRDCATARRASCRRSAAPSAPWTSRPTSCSTATTAPAAAARTSPSTWRPPGRDHAGSCCSRSSTTASRSWDKADGVVTLFPQGGAPIEIALDEHGSSRMCALALLENKGGTPQRPARGPLHRRGPGQARRGLRLGHGLDARPQVARRRPSTGRPGCGRHRPVPRATRRPSRPCDAVRSRRPRLPEASVTPVRGARVPAAPDARRVIHFGHLSDAEREHAVRRPAPAVHPRLRAATSSALALGATLYSPGTRPTLAADARRAASIGATSTVWCLEDAIAHADVPGRAGQRRRPARPCSTPTTTTACRCCSSGSARPSQLLEVAAPGRPGRAPADRLRAAQVRSRAAGRGVDGVAARPPARTPARRVYGMPVLEHEDLAWTETRAAHLAGVRALLDDAREHVLAVRVGGTDLCGLFGLRRDSDTTIWEVAVVRDMLADVLNVFARRGDHVVSGPGVGALREPGAAVPHPAAHHPVRAAPGRAHARPAGARRRRRAAARGGRWTARTASPARPSSTPPTCRSSTRCTPSRARSTTTPSPCWRPATAAASSAARPAGR